MPFTFDTPEEAISELRQREYVFTLDQISGRPAAESFAAENPSHVFFRDSVNVPGGVAASLLISTGQVRNMAVSNALTTMLEHENEHVKPPYADFDTFLIILKNAVVRCANRDNGAGYRLDDISVLRPNQPSLADDEAVPFNFFP